MKDRYSIHIKIKMKVKFDVIVQKVLLNYEEQDFE